MTDAARALRAILLVALAAFLTVSTIGTQRHDSVLCQGKLGAGFPASFICDASGESPLSSVGRIDWADLDNLNLPGIFIDLLSYALLLLCAAFLWRLAIDKKA